MNDTKPITKIIAYYRLSKTKKGKNYYETIRDAYGLEDQRREVARLAAQYGAKIIGEFTEVVSGKKLHREQLDKAISMARLHKATIVIGKQDRLARNAAFILNLMESGVEFVCADRPHQSRFETRLRATIDEEEADRISERTKRALKVAKEKGVKLGSARPGAWKGQERGWRQAVKASGAARTKRAKDAYKFLIDYMCELNDKGASLWAIAKNLNELGHMTTAGKPFSDVSVLNVFKLFGRPYKRTMSRKVICIQCGREFKPAGEEQLCLGTECIADMKWRSVVEVVQGMLERGKTRGDIALALNHLGFKNARGKPFSPLNLEYVIGLLRPASA